MAESSILQIVFFSSFNSTEFFQKYISEKAEQCWALDEYSEFFFKLFPLRYFLHKTFSSHQGGEVFVKPRWQLHQRELYLQPVTNTAQISQCSFLEQSYHGTGLLPLLSRAPLLRTTFLSTDAAADGNQWEICICGACRTTDQQRSSSRGQEVQSSLSPLDVTWATGGMWAGLHPVHSCLPKPGQVRRATRDGPVPVVSQISLWKIGRAHV